MTDPERSELRALNAKVDNILTILNDPEFGIRPLVRDHEKRIRSVERWKYSIPFGVLLGIAGVIGAAVGGN